jgi:hypothetical protein
MLIATVGYRKPKAVGRQRQNDKDVEVGELSFASSLSLYVLLALIAILTLILWDWQIMVLRGRSMSNPDGSSDDWHEQKMFYGIAVADVFLACPAGVAGIALVFVNPRWGFYVLSMVSFWFVWANIMTTVTSLRFEKPKITLVWFIAFPFGILVGLSFIAWTLFHFEKIFIR